MPCVERDAVMESVRFNLNNQHRPSAATIIFYGFDRISARRNCITAAFHFDRRLDRDTARREKIVENAAILYDI